MRHVIGVWIALCLAGVTSTALAQEGRTGGETKGATEAWQAFHRSFESLIERRSKESVERLVQLREEHPEHAAAVFARPVLEMYRTRVDVPEDAIPPASEMPPVEEHPAVGDESSAVYDPAWVRYREAFVEVVARRANRGETKLRELVEKYPDHPAAGLAREVLSGLETRPPPPEPEVTDTGDVEDLSPSEEPVPGLQDDAAPLGARIAAETGGALLGGLGGTLALGAAGGALGLALAPRTVIPTVFAGFGGIMGGIGGFPAGIYLAGTWLDADGDLGVTYLGALAGLLGSGTIALAVPGTLAIQPALAASVPVVTVASAITAYELSHRAFHKRYERLSRPRIRPLVAPNRRTSGPVLGVDVQF